MDVHDMEAKDGVRMAWNIWPPNRLGMQRILLPLGCMYTPLKKVTDLKVVTYDPVACNGMNRQCGAFLNPFSYIDMRTKCWTCNFCGCRNALPPFYAEHISEAQKPLEAVRTTIEYLLPNSQVLPPVFLFVLDTSLNNSDDEPEFEKAKESLQQIMQTMPVTSLVGFVTFGTLVNVHELGFQELSKSYCFRGTKGYSAAQVATQLGLPQRVDPRQPAAGRNRFLLPISECEFSLNSVLDDLQRDRWPTQTRDVRTSRCTGAALSVAIGLLECLYAGHAGRVVLLSSGPCTMGPGQIVSAEKSETMRSHQDLQKEKPNTKFTKAALQFYASLATRAVAAGHAVDIFANSLDQIGSYEMRVMCDRTGGMLVLSDGYSTHVFKDSFKKLFERVDENGFLQMGFNATIKTVCSKEFKVSGCVGPCCGTQKKNASVGETEIGESGTVEWRMAALDPGTTLAFFFEIGGDIQQGQNAAYLQFQTLYHHPSGVKRLRVTTLARAFSDPQLANISHGFDQECAAAIMTRNAMFQVESTEVQDVLRRMDRILIRLISKFASYNRDDVTSFQLSEEFTLFPQFMYYLRRSPFMDLFNSSPDETAFYRTCLLKENTMHSLLMLQPALLSYSLDDPTPKPVLLDSLSMQKNVILLMDTFFHVVIWRGQTIQQWYDAKYHEQAEYGHLKELLMAPATDAKQILDERFPVPKFIQTAEGGSQARFLMTRVNPSRTHTTDDKNNQNGTASFAGATTQESSVVLTDDASLRVFMQALIRYAVAS
ncbi:unnamed protein product [Amoebophrya sp. A25]|nr:unnamed protein product [Amoebophrya sp. A25]|eukprot:GSA25T00023732001.1